MQEKPLYEMVVDYLKKPKVFKTDKGPQGNPIYSQREVKELFIQSLTQQGLTVASPIKKSLTRVLLPKEPILVWRLHYWCEVDKIKE